MSGGDHTLPLHPRDPNAGLRHASSILYGTGIAVALVLDMYACKRALHRAGA